MRIWDLDPSRLCRKHLLGEHRELHALYTILSLDKKGYRSHPETKRWEGKLPALKKRHEQLTIEMKNRGYNHLSPLTDAEGNENQTELLHTIAEQEQILRTKNCNCQV